MIPIRTISLVVLAIVMLLFRALVLRMLPKRPNKKQKMEAKAFLEGTVAAHIAKEQRQVIDTSSQECAKRPRNVADWGDYAHPSHAVHACIDKTMSESRGDVGQLCLVERNFLRAYELDSRITNGGLEDFFYEVCSKEAWSQTYVALVAVGASEIHPIFREMLDLDGVALDKWRDDPSSDFEHVLSKNYSKIIWDARPGDEFIEKLTYMERLLDRYVVNFYPWGNKST